MQDFDLIVVGAGSAGVWAAPFAARLGARVALVEKERIGGDCTHYGSVPSKALRRASRCRGVGTGVVHGAELQTRTLCDQACYLN